MLTKLRELSWKSLDAMDRAEAIYLLPISATEQHGPRLPLGTDDIILEAALDALEVRRDVEGNFLRLPTVHYGNSHEHLAFPGTVSLACATVAKIVEDVLQCMRAHGFTRLAVVNSHGGNSALLEAYAQEWEQKYGVKIHVVSFWASDFFQGARGLIETPLERDVHAGEIETSLLLHIAPGLVSQEPAEDVLTGLPAYHPGWLTGDLSPGNGAIGGASHATAEEGARLFAYLCDRLAAALNEVAGS